MISIIIPVYNHAKELVECLQSLVDQTEKDFEVIVVDDGSRAAFSVERSAFSFPIEVIRFDQNCGAPVARNEGFRHSKGDLVIFLDADVDLEPQALEIMKQTLGDHPEAAFAYSSFYFGWKLFRGRLFDTQALRQQNYIHTSSLMRRAAFPGFDESLKKFQDWDLWLSIAEHGGRGVWIEEPLFRVKTGGRRSPISHWLPKAFYRIPWPILGYTPPTIRSYREAEEIVKRKHQI